jgi:hypothetical protein
MPNGSSQRIGISKALAREKSERFRAPVTSPTKRTALPSTWGATSRSKKARWPGWTIPARYERTARESRRLDRPMRPLVGGHPADPEEVVVLLALQRPVRHRDRVRDHRQRPEAGGGVGELRPADRDQRALMSVAGVEGSGLRGELSVQGVDEWRPQAVGHRQRGEAAVVVHDVEAVAASHPVDQLEGPRHVVGLVEGALDLVRVRDLEQRQHLGDRFRARRAEQRHRVAATDERLGERVDHRLDPAVTGRRNGDPGRREHRDPQRSLLAGPGDGEAEDA